MSKVDELLEAEAEAAEAYEMPKRLPNNVRVEQPNRLRSVVVSVRLSSDEHEEIRQAAEAANLPVSTILRLWALDRLHAERTGGTVADRLARLERAVFRRSA
jgi:hypothetical protein